MILMIMVRVMVMKHGVMVRMTHVFYGLRELCEIFMWTANGRHYLFEIHTSSLFELLYLSIYPPLLHVHGCIKFLRFNGFWEYIIRLHLCQIKYGNVCYLIHSRGHVS